MKPNIYKLNYKDAIKDIYAIPNLMKRAIANLMLDWKEGRRKDDPGSDEKRFKAAFNIMTAQFGRNYNYLDKQELRERNVWLNDRGKQRQQQISKDDRKKTTARRQRLRTLNREDTSRQRPTGYKKIQYVNKVLRKLQKNLDS